jgi:phosphoribosylaminoimidazole-succinocarboxamide synthase
MSLLLEAELSLPLFCRGKVRDTYNLGEELLMVATDRISAFDSVLPSGIPDKGLVLNRLSAFWFEKTSHIIPNHLVEVMGDIQALNSRIPPENRGSDFSHLVGRSMVVKRAKMIPIECIVRGYLVGSAWAEYQSSGTLYGMSLPSGMEECQQLPQPAFTPTTKAESGHDLPLTGDELKSLVGDDVARELRDVSLSIYRFAQEYAQTRGIIIADTKLEFGFIDGELSLVDELLTPDSSRFWDVASFGVGHPQLSFDKQPVRDWLVGYGWDKEPPAPPLPPRIIEETSQRYREAYHRLTGENLRDGNSQ